MQKLDKFIILICSCKALIIFGCTGLSGDEKYKFKQEAHEKILEMESTLVGEGVDKFVSNYFSPEHIYMLGENRIDSSKLLIFLQKLKQVDPYINETTDGTIVFYFQNITYTETEYIHDGGKLIVGRYGPTIKEFSIFKKNGKWKYEWIHLLR